MTRVLVTGAAGFIGSHVCDRLLAEGHRVLGVDDLSTGQGANLAAARGHGDTFRFHRADIRDASLPALFRVARPDVVVHLAAQSAVGPSLEDPLEDAGINVLGSVNVLRAASQAGARRVIYAASGGTLYGASEDMPFTEDRRFGSRPRSPYGISKKVVEDYLWFFREHHGIDFVMLALANVYGPRQDPHGEAGVVAAFGARMLRGEEPVIFGDGEQTRDYVYVEDVARAFALALDAGSEAVLNIGTGTETTVNGISAMLAEVTGFDGEPAFGPPRRGDLRRSAVDPSMAERVLGWRPTTSLRDGMERTVASLRP